MGVVYFSRCLVWNYCQVLGGIESILLVFKASPEAYPQFSDWPLLSRQAGDALDYNLHKRGTVSYGKVVALFPGIPSPLGDFLERKSIY